MTNEQFNKLRQMEKEFLDTKDLRQIIYENQGESAWKLMDRIESLCGDEYESTHDDFSLFNCFSQYDFVKYIENRYGIKYREETEYYFNI